MRTLQITVRLEDCDPPITVVIPIGGRSNPTLEDVGGLLVEALVLVAEDERDRVSPPKRGRYRRMKSARLSDILPRPSERAHAATA